MSHLWKRRSIRLRDYDYTQNGAYFVTICAYEQQCRFGRVMDNEMVLNAWGRIVEACWDEIPSHYPMVELDTFVVMPNHVHGVIVIVDDGGLIGITDSRNVAEAQYIAPVPPTTPKQKRGATPNNVAPNSLGAIVRTFKSAVTRTINRLPDAPDYPVWQRNYYEHIIRNEESLNTIREYIANNPAKWAEDSLYAE